MGEEGQQHAPAELPAPLDHESDESDPVELLVVHVRVCILIHHCELSVHETHHHTRQGKTQVQYFRDFTTP